MTLLWIFAYQGLFFSALLAPYLGIQGFELAGILSASFLVLQFLFSEMALSWIMSRRFSRLPGLGESAQRARVPAENIRVMAFPTAFLLVARSAWGSGKIIVSQGLLSRMSESELEVLLKRADELRPRPDRIVRTISALHFHFLDSFASLLTWSSVSTLVRMMLLPLRSALPGPLRLASKGTTEDSALRKLGSAPVLANPIALVS